MHFRTEGNECETGMYCGYGGLTREPRCLTSLILSECTPGVFDVHAISNFFMSFQSHSAIFPLYLVT